MSGNATKNAGISPAPAAEVAKMSAVVEARHLISDIAGPLPAGTQIQEMLTRVARVTGMGQRRLRGIWNSEARALRAEELDALREAARRRRAQEATDRHEFQELTKRLALLEARVAQIDPEFHRASLDACREQANAVGHMDRAMAQGPGAMKGTDHGRIS